MQHGWRSRHDARWLMRYVPPSHQYEREAEQVTDKEITQEIKRDYLIHLMTSMPQLRQEVADILDNEMELL